MTAWYNEIDPFAAQWLRNLIAAGHIPNGVVDERDIRDVRPSDLDGFDQCHFFAGIGGWARALRLAGWPDDRPVWTGSCPCQPFSAAGRRGGTADERHLWPHWYWLIAQRHPAIVFGEQVASKDGLGWLDAVCADMEAAGYAIGAADLCAAGVEAPHIRQRLWFVADATNGGCQFVARQRRVSAAEAGNESLSEFGVDGEAGELDHTSGARGGRDAGAILGAQREGDSGRRAVGRVPHESIVAGEPCDVGDAGRTGLAVGSQPEDGRGTLRDEGSAAGATGARQFWSDAEWIWCRDGKYRPVEPGTFPLAHGIPGRVGKLRAYGNAIVPQVAAEFIEAYLGSECRK